MSKGLGIGIAVVSVAGIIGFIGWRMGWFNNLSSTNIHNNPASDTPFVAPNTPRPGNGYWWAVRNGVWQWVNN